MQMNEVKAREILKDSISEQNNGLSFYYSIGYISWNVTDSSITMEGDFTIEDLDAILWWMRNNKEIVGLNENTF